jgi:hypothetical protein
MNAEMGCEQVRQLAPELALGVVCGQERDAALRHLAGCASCRRSVSELSSIGEDLLLLAPPRDPPPGFEHRVVARLTAAPAPVRRAPRWGSLVAAAAAVILVGAIAAGSVLVATSDDRRLAATYKALLGQAGGSYFAVARLESPRGRVGTVFGYQGGPSWLFVTLPGGTQERFEVRLVLEDGTAAELGQAEIGGTVSGWGTAIPVDLARVRELRLDGPRGDLVASFQNQDPWQTG